MKKTNAKIIGGILVLAIVLVAVAYAAITNIELNISGTGKAEGSQNNFVVEFVGTPATSGSGEITATIDEKVKTKGTMNVTKLTTKGEKAIAQYTVKNKSAELSANLKAEAAITNEKYFDIECSLEKTTLKAQEETVLTVTVTLLRTPVDESKEDVTADITATITAEPKQPESESGGGTSGGGTTAGKTTAGTYLPTGFTEVTGTTLDNGLTIQDSKGNQYVWVEVPKTEEVYPTAGLEITEFTAEEYTAIETDLHTYTSDYREADYEDKYVVESDSGKIASGLTSEQYYALKQKMLKSIYQNGGFYIGKYETGVEGEPREKSSIDTTSTPVIKQNVYPYNYVKNAQAQALASGMESGNYNTSLMFGVQWDLVLKYLEKKGISQSNLKENSTGWGNYLISVWTITNKNSKYAINSNGAYGEYIIYKWNNGAYGEKTSQDTILLSTGASEIFKKMGIYDLAGNLEEWVLEQYQKDSVSTVRGGAYQFCVAGRRNLVENSSYADVGFRIALY